jgi:hypothetical protein
MLAAFERIRQCPLSSQVVLCTIPPVTIPVRSNHSSCGLREGSFRLRFRKRDRGQSSASRSCGRAICGEPVVFAARGCVTGVSGIRASQASVLRALTVKRRPQNRCACEGCVNEWNAWRVSGVFVGRVCDRRAERVGRRSQNRGVRETSTGTRDEF